MTEEQRAWERARRAILRRLEHPTDENYEAAHDQVERLVEVMERPQKRPPRAA
jgi:hypothetical protein